MYISIMYLLKLVVYDIIFWNLYTQNIFLKCVRRQFLRAIIARLWHDIFFFELFAIVFRYRCFRQMSNFLWGKDLVQIFWTDISKTEKLVMDEKTDMAKANQLIMENSIKVIINLDKYVLQTIQNYIFLLTSHKNVFMYICKGWFH